MRTKKLDFENGFIEYKVPNVPQALRLLNSLNLEELAKADTSGSVPMGDLADILESLEPYVVNVDVDGCKTFDELLYETSSIEKLMLVFTEISNTIAGSSPRKK